MKFRMKDNANMVQNDAIGPINLAGDCVCAIGLQTDHDNAANAALVPEISYDGVTFVTLAMIDTTDAATVKTSLIGVDKAARIDGIAGYQVRARRSDANGGNCKGTLIISQRRP